MEKAGERQEEPSPLSSATSLRSLITHRDQFAICVEADCFTSQIDPTLRDIEY